MRSKRSKKPILRASKEKRFFVHNGTALSDLRELRDALACKAINDEQFFHHVQAGRNDFAEWIRHVLGDVKCADSLRRTKSRKGVLGVIERALKQYQ